MCGRDAAATRLPLMSSPMARRRLAQIGVSARQDRRENGQALWCTRLTNKECTRSAHSGIDHVPQKMTLMHCPRLPGKFFSRTRHSSICDVSRSLQPVALWLRVHRVAQLENRTGARFLCGLRSRVARRRARSRGNGARSDALFSMAYRSWSLRGCEALVTSATPHRERLTCYERRARNGLSPSRCAPSTANPSTDDNRRWLPRF